MFGFAAGIFKRAHSSVRVLCRTSRVQAPEFTLYFSVLLLGSLLRLLARGDAKSEEYTYSTRLYNKQVEI